MKTRIELRNMRFFAYHGVFPQETVVGGEFVVNLSFEADLTKACQTDDIDDTVNYAQVFEIVKNEMEIPSKIIEHAAYRIFNKIKSVFPNISCLEVRLAKMNPPVSGAMESSEIIINE